MSGKEHDVSGHEAGKTKHIACGDVVTGCKFTATAPTEEELIGKVVAHAAAVHGVTEVTPDLAAKVKAAIKTV
jgi:predicted small metal-binding protein